MLTLKLLGQFDVRLDGQPVALPSRPAQALLACLALGQGAAQRRERLAGRLWPEATEANARAYLRQALWRVRRALAAGGHAYVLADDLTVRLDPAAPLALDVAELERDGDSPEALAASVGAYAGELLPGFYEDWVAAERERLRAVFEAKLARLLDALAAAERWAEVIEWAERGLALGAAPEPPTRGLMRAHGALGNRAGVAGAYQRCLQALQADLGVDPSAQTRSVYAAALAAAGGEGPQPPPERPAPAPSTTPAPFNNLPAPATPFVGRAEELAEIAARLALPECRLLTLIGPGGIGKTRLALEAAADAARAGTFAEGVCLVPLALIADAEYLGHALAEALELSLYGGQPAEAQLLSYLRGREMLLVVDMFEHVLEGADLLSTLLAGAPRLKLLVTSQERLNLRGEWLLPVEGMAVPPDAAPYPDLEAYSAVRLFIQCAQRVEAAFVLDDANRAAVARLCRLVGGMPLGLELAAAWLRALPVAAIADAIEREAGFLGASLRDLPERHRSLQAVFDHSWRRLPPEAQAIYGRLAVLRGSFGRAAAAQVSGAGLADLAALVDKSLLRRVGADRYEMHALLRRYALAQLEAAGEAEAARQRHLDHWLALTEAAEPGLRGAEQLAWLARLEAEHDNLRAALEWAAQAGPPVAVAGLRLAGALGRFWYLRGYWLEGRHWLRKLLGKVEQPGEGEGAADEASSGPRRPTTNGRRALSGAAGNAPDDPVSARHPPASGRAAGGEGERPLRKADREILLARARAWAALGWLANENAGEEEAYSASLALYRAAGDAWGTAYALRGLGARSWGAGDGERASAYLDESLRVFRALGDEWGQALVALNLGWVDHDADRLDAAGAAWREALALFERTGDRWGQAVALSNLGYLARLLLDDAEAAAKNEAALALFEALGDRAGTATTLVRLGQVALRRANLDQARRLFEQTLTLQQKLEPGWETMTALSELGLMAAVHGDHERARALFEQGVALAETVNYYTPIADLHYNRAQAAYYAGDLDLADAAWAQSVRQYVEQQDPVGAALARAGLALVAWRRGDVAAAHPALTAALDEVRAGGDRRDLAHTVLALGRVTLARGDGDAAGPLIEEARALYHKLGDRHGLAQALEAEADLHLAWHAPNSAARRLGAAQALRAALNAPVPAIDAPAHARLLERLRLELGEDALEAALRAGEGDRGA